MRVRCALIALAIALAPMSRGVAPASAEPEVGADERRQAKRAFDRGQKQFSLGRFDVALVSYEEAYETYPLPGILFNIGQCHRNIGNLDEAIFSFKKYLQLVPDADNYEAVESLIRDLDRERRRAGGGDPIVPPPVDRPPIYRRWWFWTGLAVVAGTAATIALTAEPKDSIPPSDLGNIPFP